MGIFHYIELMHFLEGRNDMGKRAWVFETIDGRRSGRIAHREEPWFARSFVWTFCLSLFWASVSLAAEKPAPPAKSGNAGEWTAHLSINGRIHQLSLSTDGAFANVESLTSEFPNSFELLGGGLELTVDGVPLRHGEVVDCAVNKIAYDEHLTLIAGNGDETRTIYIRTLNSLLPSIQSAGASPYPGHYYITTIATKTLMKLDGKGDVVYYLRPGESPTMELDLAGGGPAAAVGVDPGFWDFKKHTLPDGKIRYSYHDHNPDYNRLRMGGFGGGERVILDERYREIARFKVTTDPSSSIDAAEGHDFILLDDDHYIVSAYEPRLVYNVPVAANPNPQGSKVVAARLQEVKKGKVIFDWASTDHDELYLLSEAPFNDFANTRFQFPDYAHFNSMDIDSTDGNLVCSFRNLSSILKIDRRTGKILWVLSGEGDQFGLNQEQKTSNQHYARLTPEGWLTVFDNNVRNRKTRVLKMKLDETGKSVTEYSEFFVGPRFSVVCGSAQNIAGDVFVVGWGGSVDGQAVLTEIDFAANKKLFELSFPKGIHTYRCVKYE